MFKLTSSLQKDEAHTHIWNMSLKVQIEPHTIAGMGKHINFMHEFNNTFFKMITELSKVEVEARRPKKEYLMHDQLKLINEFLELTENELTYRALLT